MININPTLLNGIIRGLYPGDNSTISFIQKQTGLTNANDTLLTESAIVSLVNGHSTDLSPYWTSAQTSANDTLTYNLSTGYTNTQLLGYSLTSHTHTTFNNDILIRGNLTISGITYHTNVQYLDVKSNYITINSGETGSGVTAGYAGIVVKRGSSTDYNFDFDEINGQVFRIGMTGNTQAVATRNESGNMNDSGLTYWNASQYRLDTTSYKYSDILTGYTNYYTKSQVNTLTANTYNSSTGYTYSQISGITSSQWTTSGSSIYYGGLQISGGNSVTYTSGQSWAPTKNGLHSLSWYNADKSVELAWIDAINNRLGVYVLNVSLSGIFGSTLLASGTITAYGDFQPQANISWLDVGSATRYIQVNRPLFSSYGNVNGGNVNISASAPTSKSPNFNGGNLVLSSGIATGSGSSYISFLTASVAAAGTGDTTPTEKVRISPKGQLLVNKTTEGSYFLDVNGGINGVGINSTAELYAANNAAGFAGTGTQFWTDGYQANTLFNWSFGVAANTDKSIGVGRNQAVALGRNLTIQAGGAKAVTTNLNGGNLILSSGIATGSGSSYISFMTVSGGTSGTTDATATEVLRITSTGNLITKGTTCTSTATFTTMDLKTVTVQNGLIISVV